MFELQAHREGRTPKNNQTAAALLLTRFGSYASQGLFAPKFMDDFYLEEEARCKKNKVPWQWFGHAAAGHAIAQGLQA